MQQLCPGPGEKWEIVECFCISLRRGDDVKQWETLIDQIETVIQRRQSELYEGQ